MVQFKGDQILSTRPNYLRFGKEHQNITGLQNELKLWNLWLLKIAMFRKNTYSQSWGQSSYNITEATSFAPWVYFSCNKNYGHSSGTYNRCLRPGSLWTNSIICGSSFGQPCLTSHGLGMIAYKPNSTSTTLLELHVRCLLQCTGPICLVRTIGRY